MSSHSHKERRSQVDKPLHGHEPILSSQKFQSELILIMSQTESILCEDDSSSLGHTQHSQAKLAPKFQHRLSEGMKKVIIMLTLTRTEQTRILTCLLCPHGKWCRPKTLNQLVLDSTARQWTAKLGQTTKVLCQHWAKVPWRRWTLLFLVISKLPGIWLQ